MGSREKGSKKTAEAHKRNIGYGQEGDPLAPATKTVILPLTPKSGMGLEGELLAWPSAPPLDGGGEAAAAGPEECKSPPPSTDPPDPPPQKASLDQSISQSDRFKHPLHTPDPIPGAQSDLRGEMARQRREVWTNLAQEALREGDEGLLEATNDMAFPVEYTPVVNDQGQQVGHQGEYTPLDWKLLLQLRQTVSQYGFKSEPVKQMLNYLFDSTLLLPNDLKGITKLIFTQHQQLLFNAHWQTG